MFMFLKCRYVQNVCMYVEGVEPAVGSVLVFRRASVNTSRLTAYSLPQNANIRLTASSSSYHVHLCMISSVTILMNPCHLFDNVA